MKKNTELGEMSQIEKALESMEYKDIPKGFLRLLNIQFDKYSYLKGVVEMKKAELNQKL